jgi:predicted short-subunit dehydrogenase-like oxidoreductase (DUF2520 family)
MSPPLIGVIGTGRVGSALAAALVAAGYPVGPVCGRGGESATRLAARLPGATAVASAQAVADAAGLVLIATPDRAIQPAAEGIRWRPGMAVVHTSGGTPVSALSAAACAGALIGGWHPLKSFAGGEADADLRGITFAVEAQGHLREWLHALTEALGGRALDLNAADRARYHASAALASNALVALLADAASLWTDFGWSRADALRALLPLVRGTVANLDALGLPRALTGPVERGDIDTVRAHLDALADGPPAITETYRQLSRRALDLAVEKGGITGEDTSSRLAGMLDGRTCGVVVE